MENGRSRSRFAHPACRCSPGVQAAQSALMSHFYSEKCKLHFFGLCVNAKMEFAFIWFCFGCKKCKLHPRSANPVRGWVPSALHPRLRFERLARGASAMPPRDLRSPELVVQELSEKSTLLQQSLSRLRSDHEHSSADVSRSVRRGGPL